MNKYKVEHTFQVYEFREKAKLTCTKKYGVDNPWKSVTIREKIKDTHMKKYGVEHNWQIRDIDGIRACDKTCIKKYGVIAYHVMPKKGKHETSILNEIEIKQNIHIIRDFRIGPYYPDGYCKENNTVYEIYEKYHYSSLAQQEYDKKRQNYIQNKLKCSFVVINDLNFQTLTRSSAT